jgi:triosephosphate isomerase
MRKALVAGNWKMNGTINDVTELTSKIGQTEQDNVDIMVVPSFVHMHSVGEILSGTNILLAGQDCSEFDQGAFTGETCADMLVDLGCTHVIVGHSERRQFFGDDDSRVAQKARKAEIKGLCPIVCVGETLEERDSGRTRDVIERQLCAVFKVIENKFVIAYEPVWAIGTGKSATPEMAQEVHENIRQYSALRSQDNGLDLRILYGGSVKPDNADELFSMPDIDGGLIGGASLDSESFLKICRSAAKLIN